MRLLFGEKKERKERVLNNADKFLTIDRELWWLKAQQELLIWRKKKKNKPRGCRKLSENGKG